VWVSEWDLDANALIGLDDRAKSVGTENAHGLGP
jgi:hypothetical protein